MKTFDDVALWRAEVIARGLVIHDNGAPADPENGPSTDEIPTALVAYEDVMDEAGFKTRGWFELVPDPDRPEGWARGYLFDSFEELMAFTDEDPDGPDWSEGRLDEEADETRGDLGGDTIYVTEDPR